MAITVLPTDREFSDSPEAGDLYCICSRCGEVIGGDDFPIRAWPHPHPLEYRFHPGCLGLRPEDVDPADYYDVPVDFKKDVTWKWVV